VRSIVVFALLALLLSCIPTKERLRSQQNVESKEILEASARGDLEAVKKLLEDNPELVNARNDVGATPLSNALASRFLNRELMVFLLAHGADPNGRGILPLSLAIGKGDKEATLLLLSHGADANRKESYGQRPLHRLLFLPDGSELAELLLGHGAEPDVFVAAAFGDTESLRKLLDADPKLARVAGDDGMTALHWAAIRGHKDAAHLLLARGADPRARNKVGLSSYAAALEGGHEEIARLLAP
jgi:ankyrin repeat protein